MAQEGTSLIPDASLLQASHPVEEAVAAHGSDHAAPVRPCLQGRPGALP
jgi:hypothetical protein